MTGLNNAFDGTSYTIDLSKKIHPAFEKALKPYLDAATRVPNLTRRRVASTGSTKSGRDLAALRAWATEQGIEVSERGRVSKPVLDQYDAAH